MGLADGIYNSLYKLGEYISDNTTYFNNTTGLTEEDIDVLMGTLGFEEAKRPKKRAVTKATIKKAVKKTVAKKKTPEAKK